MIQYGFKNQYDMYKSTEHMECQEIDKGIVLPRIYMGNAPMWGLGGVCDNRNQFVELSKFHGGWAEHGGYYSWKDEEYRDDSVVYFGLFFKHWGHFLVDLIGRMWFFAQSNNEKKNWKVAYIGEEEPTGNYLEFFELLGIKEEQLIHVTNPTRFRKVIVPQFSCRPCIWYTKEFQSIFHYIAEKVEKEKYVYDKKELNKVYFTRLNFTKAQGTEVGEEYIAKWLKSNGYSLISPEKLSLRDQVYIWNHAKEIVCMDGTIPINVGFSKNKGLQLTVMHKTALVHKNLDLYLLMSGCNVTLLDVYREPFKKYPKSIGEGPFLFSLNGDIQEYSHEKNMKIPFSSKEIQIIERKNYIKYVARIINIKGRIRVILSKLYHSIRK